jgi:hypothetical protein
MSKYSQQQVADLLSDAEARLDGKYGAPTLYEIEEILEQACFVVRKLELFDDEVDARISALWNELDALASL